MVEMLHHASLRRHYPHQVQRVYLTPTSGFRFKKQDSRSNSKALSLGPCSLILFPAEDPQRVRLNVLEIWDNYKVP